MPFKDTATPLQKIESFDEKIRLSIYVRLGKANILQCHISITDGSSVTKSNKKMEKFICIYFIICLAYFVIAIRHNRNNYALLQC